MEKSTIYKKSPEEFYKAIDTIYERILSSENIGKYRVYEWSNVL
jgi:hypothetical protein